jgi:hypothetical protein
LGHRHDNSTAEQSFHLGFLSCPGVFVLLHMSCQISVVPSATDLVEQENDQVYFVRMPRDLLERLLTLDENKSVKEMQEEASSLLQQVIVALKQATLSSRAESHYLAQEKHVKAVLVQDGFIKPQLPASFSAEKLLLKGDNSQLARMEYFHWLHCLKVRRCDNFKHDNIIYSSLVFFRQRSVVAGL